MSIFSYLRKDMLARFIAAIRQEGFRSTVARTWAYIKADRAGQGRSALLNLGAGHPSISSVYLARFWQELARKDAFHISQPPSTTTTARRIAMIGDLNLPQCRKYRVEQLVEFWGAQGIDFAYAHYEDIPRATGILHNATHLMFYRSLNTPLTSMYLYEARRLRLPILYDLDDPLFSISAYETYENMKALPPRMKAHFITEAPKYLDAMNLADIVTVSTPEMRDHTRLYTNRPVYFRRNFADAETFSAADAALRAVERGDDSPFRVAFASGSMGHEIDFALISDDIVAFLAADPARQLVILGHFDKTLLPDGLQGQLETHAFAGYDAYLETLASVDCAVMPLTDDIFNRCKSAVRVIDASAVAVPSLVTTVGDMANMVRDGETGRILAAGDSWLEALEGLAADRDATKHMGQAARSNLEANWSNRTDLPIVEPEVLDWVKA